MISLDGSQPAYLYRLGIPNEESKPARCWFEKALLHRTDGPAVVWPDGEQEWWLDGVQYDCLTWMLKVHELGVE